MPGGTVIRAEQPITVFVSYRRQDAAGHAGRLADGLIAMLGRERVFVDVDSIEPGHDFVRAITDALSRTDVLLVVIGRSWLTASTEDGVRRLDCADDFVRLELETAFRDAIRVVPLLVQGATMPAGSALPDSLQPLSRCNAVVLHDTQWLRDVDHLVRKLSPRDQHHQIGVETEPARFSATEPKHTVPQTIIGAIPHAAAALQPRAHLLQRLDDLRAARRGAVVGAVTGTRGVGKTQLAAEYARAAVADGWPVVVWVVAEREDQVVAGLAELADTARVRVPDSDPPTAAKAALAWLRSHPGPCLLVYDNAEDPDVVAQWMPTVGNVQTVVTTVRPVFGNLGEAVTVDLFAEPEALDYLRQRTGLDDAEGARQVAEQLGHLPLALAQAAAVIGRGRTHPSYPTYLTRLAGVPVDEQLRHVLGDPYPIGAAQALHLSIEQLTRDDPDGLATHLLNLLAVLSPAGVNLSLLDQAAAPRADAHDTEHLDDRAGSVDDGAAFDAALSLLADRSLATPTVDGQAVTVHRLIQRVARERLARAGQLDAVISQAAAAIDRALIPAEQAWARRLAGDHQLTQIQALWNTATQTVGGPTAVGATTTAVLLSQRVWSISHLNQAYDPNRAIELGTDVSADCERFLGADHPDTLTSLSNLAYAHRSTGRLSEAIPLYERSLADRERVLGADHRDTLSSRSNLAYAYRTAGRLLEATVLYERTLADRERVLGADHPDTLSARNHLAGAYRLARRLSEAIPLYERTLADRERVLGADHPDSLTSRHDLAYAYTSAGRLSESIPLYERTVADRERVLGADHPDTLATRNDLADTYMWAGRLSEAITLHQRTLADRERTLGPDHPYTLESRSNLASTYAIAGQLSEAIPLHERTLADSVRVLGPDHPDTFTLRHNLASAYQSAGRLADAVALFERTVSVLVERSGPTTRTRFPRATTWPAPMSPRAVFLTPSRCTNVTSPTGSGYLDPTTPTRCPRATTWPAPTDRPTPLDRIKRQNSDRLRTRRLRCDGMRRAQAYVRVPSISASHGTMLTSILARSGG